jgi:hypothetical protein
MILLLRDVWAGLHGTTVLLVVMSDINEMYSDDRHVIMARLITWPTSVLLK